MRRRQAGQYGIKSPAHSARSAAARCQVRGAPLHGFRAKLRMRRPPGSREQPSMPHALQGLANLFAVSTGNLVSGTATRPLPRFFNLILVGTISISRYPSPARISSGWPGFQPQNLLQRFWNHDSTSGHGKWRAKTIT